MTPLTKRQLEIAELAASGLTNREIGRRLFLSPDTIKSHMQEILRRTNSASRSELGLKIAGQSTFLTTQQVVGMLGKARVEYADQSGVVFGSTEFYRREGAVMLLDKLIQQLGAPLRTREET